MHYYFGAVATIVSDYAFKLCYGYDVTNTEINLLDYTFVNHLFQLNMIASFFF